jgi:hypothetical protein
LTDLQAEAVEKYIDGPSASPADLQNLSEHYRTSVDVMEHMVNKNSCPAEVLETVYANLVGLQKDPAPTYRGNLALVLQTIAWHPNVSVPLLIKLLDNDYSGPRLAASANPKLPQAPKIAYLRKAAFSKEIPEHQAAAMNPDCPPEILEQLAADPIGARDVASNPNAPIELLQRLVNSNDSGTRIRATATLAKRHAPTP